MYGIDPLQDETDLALVRFALKKGLPLLTICRGTQVANLALGGTLVQHMSNPHLNQISTIEFQNLDSDIGVTAPLQVSCFHHQAIDKLDEGISEQLVGLRSAVASRGQLFIRTQPTPHYCCFCRCCQKLFATSLSQLSMNCQFSE